MTDLVGDADIAEVAALFADPARARMLLALCSGAELSASELADEAGLSAPATSAHLGKLLAAGLVRVRPSGRFRRYRLAGQQVVTVLEVLARMAPPAPVRTLRAERRARAVRFARICYDHLAGELAVRVASGLLATGAMVEVAGVDGGLGDPQWQPGPNARRVFPALGVRAARVHGDHANHLLRPCLDWSAGRLHLAGGLGTALLDALLERGWLAGRTGQRAVTLTAGGSAGLRDVLGIDVPPL